MSFITYLNNSRYIIRSIAKPNLVWSASRGSISLKPFDVTDKYQEWELIHGGLGFKNVAEGKAIKYVDNDNSIVLEEPDSFSSRQRFAFEQGANTSIKSQYKENDYLLTKNHYGDELVYANTDNAERWKVIRKENSAQ
ncbi:hypothetical protein RhiirA4_428169 [Rhizophagus irregularis]|uniref:Uncharacterized protein n=1 Tax=Rhizophagus irregularis TaxID=588596 RepID=A0A2I1HBS6_9GLOM|nr:hypothetical protein RhiirA4_428169 [Rhizophagus irregularis]